ncbi:uncharacterized protein LOC127151303 [Cucumis melo]|uniref:Uncharacterized protein LOC127151303 n=1 Tax=Cucumis melo TaxID=3656 RepID=A0ABM3L9M2_CUCME|nr:uncharacterized protein LOC127151303 [Cucumis melo]
MLHNCGGVVSTPIKARMPSTHGSSSRLNCENALSLIMPRQNLDVNSVASDTGSILDYVKEFTTLMLEIGYLPEKEALFQFKDGLKDWAKIELDRRNVQTLDDAIAAAETLVDYSTQSKGKKPDPEKHGGKPDKTKNFGRKDEGKVKTFQWRNGKNDGAHRGESSNPSEPCFICKGPHWTTDRPNRKALNALVAKFQVGKATYKVELPQKLKIHNIFHVSMLKPFHEDQEDLNRSETSRAPTGVVTEFDRKIKEILAERKIRRRGVPSYSEYLILWEGLPESEASWEREDLLWQFQQEIEKFKENATGTLRNQVGEGVTPQK